jgi:hypothetical protein
MTYDLSYQCYFNPFMCLKSCHLFHCHEHYHHHHHHQPTIVHCWAYVSLIVRHLARSSATPIQLLPAVLRDSTWPETRAPLRNLFTPMVVGSPASPLPLQRANTVCYVGDFSSLPDHFVSDSIPQRNLGHSSFHSSLSEKR